MLIKNARLFPTALAFGKTAEGAPFLSVIIKGTFRLGNGVAPGRLAPRQLPISAADEPYDPKDPTCPLKLEADLVPFKPRSDVILVGHAYAPHGRPAKIVDVEIQVGALCKKLRVFGDRAWSFPSAQVDAIPLIIGPADFVKMPLTWDRAFGGIDKTAPIHPGNPPKKPWCERNYLGRGFCGERTVSSIHNTPLPNIEDPDNLIRTWDSYPRPAGCGFFPRNSRPRADWLGTFDEKWKIERAPAMPIDFRFDAYNGADLSMQVSPCLSGDELVRLTNVVEGWPTMQLSLPCIAPKISASTSSGERSMSVILDTLVLLPDAGQFYLVWRATLSVADELGTDVNELRLEYSMLQPAGDPLRDARVSA